MDNKTKQIESLLEKTIEYGKSGFELIKLKTLEKTADIISSFIPLTIVFTLIASFLIFCSLGAAMWLGEILQKPSYGFFIVAAFYGLVAIIVHFAFHKCIKVRVSNYIIKLVLKSDEI